MVTSIGYSLGAGAGIDTKALIEELAKAQKAPKEALITKRETANTARVSALAEASNAIDSFASALSKLIAGGTLFTQPSVSDTSVLTASAMAGADIGNLSAQIEVRQLAQPQTLVSANLASTAAPVGQGTLTLTTALGTHTITVDSTNDSLSGLARAINAQNSGVSASVVADGNGARLMLKGPTGEANAFSLSVPAGTTGGLERFVFDPAASANPMAIKQVAQDAIVRLDGIDVQRSTNSFNNLIPGVQIDLKKAAPGSPVALGTARPTEAMAQAVSDFVEAYNELQAMLAKATAVRTDKTEAGPLRGDIGIRKMQQELARLTTTPLSSGAFKTLAEIGVATNRDGTLRLDTFKLNDALEKDPSAVEGLFNPRQYSSHPGVTVVSKVGFAKPGTYQLTNLLAPVGTGNASGFVGGKAMVGNGALLTAPYGSPASGLSVRVDADVANATITIEAGLGGALQAIRDELRATDGPLATSKERLEDEADRIADDREALERRSDAYYQRLVSTFASMDRQVNAFKATQSYLDQQIKMWSNSKG